MSHGMNPQNLSYDEIKDRVDYGAILNRQAHGEPQPGDGAELARLVKAIGIDAATLAVDSAHFVRCADALKAGDRAEFKRLCDSKPAHLIEWGYLRLSRP